MTTCGFQLERKKDLMKETVYHGYVLTGTADYNARGLNWRVHARISWSGRRQEVSLDDPTCFTSREQAEEYALSICKDWVNQRLGPSAISSISSQKRALPLRSHPKMTWQGKPLWNPSSWPWVITIGATVSVEGIDEAGRLVTARQCREKDGGNAIELLVGFEHARFSTVIRLDDPEAIPDLFKRLNPLRGFTLKEIGDIELGL
jgi:hypothetical protein